MTLLRFLFIKGNLLTLSPIISAMYQVDLLPSSLHRLMGRCPSFLLLLVGPFTFSLVRHSISPVTPQQQWWKYGADGVFGNSSKRESIYSERETQ
jgi:hypothetical protein